MAETDLKVQIRFEATGDKELAKAFTTAANAQKKLEDVTRRYEKLQRKSNRATKAAFTNFTRLSGSMGKFRLSLATLRSNLLVFTFGFNVLNRTLGKSVRAFSEQQVAVAKLNQTLRSTSFAARLSSRELQGLAANLQKLTGIGDETIISMQGILLTFTKIKGEIFKDATEAIIDVSVAMGQDLQQSAIQVGKALNDPIIGVSALSRVGIQFTDTQKQLIKQFVRTNQIAKAQRVILDELNVQFGGTAANLDSTSFAMKRVQAAFGDFLETGGGKLAPQIERVANVLADFLEMLNNTEESRAARAFSILSEENKTLAIRSRITTKEMMRVAEQFEIISDEAMSKQGFINTLKTIDNQIRELSKQGKPLDRFLNEIMENNKNAGVTFESLFVDIDTFNDALTESFGGLQLFGSGFVGFTGDIQEYSDTILGLKNVVVEGFGTKTQLADDIALIGALTKDGIDSSEFDDFVSAFDLLGSTIQTNAGEFNVFSPILTGIMDGTIQFNNLTAQQIEKLRILRAEFVELGATYGNFPDEFKPFAQQIENFNKAVTPYTQAFDQLTAAGLLFTKNNKEVTIQLLKLRRALAIGNVILGFTEFLSKGMYAKAFSTLATGMTQVAQIKAQIESAREAATGADFVTNGRQLLMVGDNATGRERVQVTPLGNSGGGGGGDSSVTINLNGNILGTEDFVRDELIPQIENAVGRNLA